MSPGTTLQGRSIFRPVYQNAHTSQESENPKQGIQSFDAIYTSALQVVVVAGANNVCIVNFRRNGPGLNRFSFTVVSSDV